MKRKIISLLLCLVMALSLIPTVAFGVDGEATDPLTTNGFYTDNGWKAGEDGTITTTDGLTLSKTATYLSENTYRIDLKVVTTQTTTTVTTSSGAATVLVIDTSGSMAWCTKNHRHTDDCYSKEECNETNTPDHWVSWDDYFGHHAIHRTFDDNWQPLSCRRDLDGKYYKVENNCGQGAHNHDNARGGIWCNSPGLTSDTDSRIAYAKAAAKTFLDSYKDTSSTPAARWVAIVSFNNDTNSATWYDVSTKDGYNNAVNAIDALTADGGTNLDAGLEKARNLMSDDAVKNIPPNNKNVVALTDGAPTKSQHYGDGTYGSENINTETKNTAAALKGDITGLYTICFAASGEVCYQGGPSVSDFLKDSIASTGNDSTVNEGADLPTEFETISNTITRGLTGEGGWTVTDPMAANISVTGSLPTGFVQTDATKNIYTWTLSNPKVSENGNTKTYTYITSYTVTIDPNGTEADGTTKLREDTFYPTNGVTTLNYKDADNKSATANFPVPGVKVKLGSLTINKVFEGLPENTRPAYVTFTVTGTNYNNTVTLSADNQWSTTLNLAPGEYTVTENEESAKVEGYVLTAPAAQTATVTLGNTAPTSIRFTNKYEEASTPPAEVSVEIPVTKTVSAKPGSTLPKNLPNFTFKAYLGEKEVGTLTLALKDETKVPGAQNQYRGTLTANIPAADFANNNNNNNNNNNVTLTIKEVKGIDTKWTYDKDFYTVDVTLNDDGTTSYSAPMLNGKGDPLNEGITFENVYSYKYTPTPRPTTPAKPVTSVKTGDMGVALYAGLAILSMTGSAGVILRRRKNDK